MNRPQANLFIVGAAKCGTTFLADYLSQHSRVQMMEMKEPNFFSYQVLQEKGLYYNTDDVKTLENYQRLLAPNDKALYYGEASVSYLPYAQVAENIHDYNPEAKIIILLRNPADRAFSHYKMDKRLGLVSESFDKIINKTSNHRELAKYYHQYVELGLYAAQVESYINVFGKENVFVALNQNNMEEVIPRVLKFLELDSEPIVQPRSNEAIAFKNAFLSKIYKNASLRRKLKRVVPLSLAKKFTEEDEQMPTEAKRDLEFFYKTDFEQAKKYLRI